VNIINVNGGIPQNPFVSEYKFHFISHFYKIELDLKLFNMI